MTILVWQGIVAGLALRGEGVRPASALGWQPAVARVGSEDP